MTRAPRPKPLREFEWHYLFGLCNGADLEVECPPGQVTRTACFGDDQRPRALLSDSNGGDLRIWEPETGRLLLLGADNASRAIAVDRRAKVVACGDSREVHVIDGRDGTQLCQVPVSGPDYRI